MDKILEIGGLSKSPRCTLWHTAARQGLADLAIYVCFNEPERLLFTNRTVDTNGQGLGRQGAIGSHGSLHVAPLEGQTVRISIGADAAVDCQSVRGIHA